MDIVFFGVEGFSFILLLLLAGFAGFVDAVVGGGGLIQVPAIFTTFPNVAPATLLGTNKIASICGTSLASARYMGRVVLPWRMLIGAFISTLLFAFIGAKVMSAVSKEWMRALVLVLLIIVAVVTWFSKEFGQRHAPRYFGRKEILMGMLVGAVLGFYDGFFGPGMGTFLIFCFIYFFGYDFLLASAMSKILNWASNFAALTYFVPHGHVLWGVGLFMAGANISGAWIGSHMAIRRGPGFIRIFFLGILAVLIAKLSWQIWMG